MRLIEAVKSVSFFLLVLLGSAGLLRTLYAAYLGETRFLLIVPPLAFSVFYPLKRFFEIQDSLGRRQLADQKVSHDNQDVKPESESIHNTVNGRVDERPLTDGGADQKDD